ncbi:PPC domain-containing protein [bacterium]|nr:PPC domain-containing protein [bacterium]
MKKLSLLLLVFLTSLFFVGCGDDSKSENKCDGVTCSQWESCVEATGTCQVLDGRCNGNSDCTTAGEICNTANHTCEAGNPECTTSADCTDSSKPVCEDGVCVAEQPECTTNADCTDTSKPVCDNGVCVAEQGECTGLSIPADSFVYNSQYGYVAELSETDVITVAMFESTPVGSYDLASDTNDNYADCMQCILYYQFGETEEDETLKYFQSAGTINVTAGDAQTDESAGNIVSVKLIQVTIEDGTYTSTPVEGGGCYEIQTAAWDTMPEPECAVNSDCGDASYVCEDGVCVFYCNSDDECEGAFQVCNTETHHCEEGECVDDSVGSTADAATAITTLPHTDEYAICSGVADWFKFNLNEGDNLFVNVLFTDADGDLDAKLYYTLPAEDATAVASAGSVSDNESIVYIVPEGKGGEYFLKVFGYGTAQNLYTLEVKDGCTVDADCGGAPYVCNTTTSKCEEHCLSHDECPTGTYCSDSNECVEYAECDADSDCNIEDSINDGEKWYCAVLNSTPVCLVQTAHTCGGESTNDSHSVAETVLPTEDKNGVICIDDNDWYTFTLTAPVSTLTLTLSFAAGDLDLVVLGPDSYINRMGGSFEEQDPTAGGEESVELELVPAGQYYVYIYRYGYEDEDTTADVNYTLSFSEINTTAVCSTNDDCLNTLPLRSVCSEGACVNMEAEGTVAVGGFCENDSNCQVNEELYGCLDLGAGIPYYDNFCTINCTDDSDCDAVGGGWCQGFGWFGPYVCLKACTEDTYCQNIFGEETAYCEAGVCTVPQEGK